MRIRFFWTIFLVLTIVAMGATLLHGTLIHRERLELLDQQVRDTATALLDSEINGVREIEIERVEEILSEELGESRIGKFFIIRNTDGEMIFESTGAKLLPIKEIPRDRQWVTISEKGKFIRILNLNLPRIPDRTLQVGVLVDSSLVSPSYFSLANLAFIGCIFILGLGAAWGLTSTLLKPISRLVTFITGIAQASTVTLPALPKDLALLETSANKRDELFRLIESFSLLVEKVNRGHKLSRVWSYQMAHELKTPLAIAEGEIVQAKKSGELKPDTAERILSELMDASETVTSFLTWAELESAPLQKNLFAVSVRKTVLDIQLRLAKKFPNRLMVEMPSDFHVLAFPQHFEHMILNLVLNALIYSPEGAVKISLIGPTAISVVDQGPGISAKVIERMGEPFNKGEHKSNKGHGLGLAYVQSVCKLYGWNLKIENQAVGTRITLNFPNSDDDSKVFSFAT